jgi:N-acyl-D-aspartate/D-glutamate deacylase
MYDLLIQNGKIVDGSGGDCFMTNIAIRNEEIVEVGDCLGAEATMTIDAAGLVVAPGFIDHHSHSDFSLMGPHRFDNKVEQGITTEIVGQCGATLAPIRSEDLVKAAAVFGFAEDQVAVFARRLGTFSDYVDFLETVSLGDNWAKLDQVLELIRTAQKRGLKVRADMYPYLAGSTGLIDAIPNGFAAEGLEKLVENLKDTNFRETVWRELQTGTGFENLIEYCGFEGIKIFGAAEASKDLIGKSIAEIAEERSTDPFDTVCDIIVENNGGVRAGYFMREEAQPAIIIAEPFVMGGTDGSIESDILPGGHPRSIGAFPQMIRKYVREQAVVSIEEAVHKFSWMPADMAGLKNKGLIREGYDADIAIFDAETLTDHADFGDPEAKNEGMKYVIVNGVIAVENDRFTGRHAGKVLRRR